MFKNNLDGKKRWQNKEVLDELEFKVKFEAEYVGTILIKCEYAFKLEVFLTLDIDDDEIERIRIAERS